MGTLLGTTLVLISLGVLVYPFLNRRKYTLAGNAAAERLRAARLRAYRQIADLEGDFIAGDLTETDYDSQLNELRIAAAKIMRREQQIGSVVADVDALEREIAAARKGMAGPLDGGDTI
jgi:hypothetical protein